ncbi:SLC13 family permease [bacterium]|nr:SLC13 family permease [bacterium]MBU1064407.1 SLC13 family permease [bacterium]MBU1633658.1 SLC13 family permease [bacterium]MBU1873552.1 SLC13 family permease [bacterium]
MNGNDTASIRQKIGLLAGIPLFLLILLLPLSNTLEPIAQHTLAVAILMAWWWITEAIPIPATALIPVLAFPILKVLSLKEVVPSYGDSNIFLFMGGFFLAMAIQKWNLHRRIALHIIRIVGSGPHKIILGFMVATAFLSMWISNTATTMMMFPIGMAVIVQISRLLENSNNLDQKNLKSFQIALMLGIAYAASIGGIGTKIGTPPNIVFAGAVRTLFPGAPEISFLQWIGVGLPLVLIFLPLTWILLTRVLQPVNLPGLQDSSGIIEDELKKLGKMNIGERLVLLIFILTALAWIFLKDIELGAFTIPGWSNMLDIENHVNDATVAIGSAILLFSIPVSLKKREFLLDWEWAIKIPWGILLLFGGGIALANGFKCSGLAGWIGGHLGLLSHMPLIIMIMAICFLLTFLTELTSNTATAAIFMPILAMTAMAMHIHPYLLMIPATISASCAFMLPIATPPNAIIFGSGCVTIPQMAKNGVVLNLIGVIIVTIITYLVAIPLFGIVLGQMPAWAH